MVVSLLALTLAATVQSPPATANGDPNEKICESVPTIGSRLAKKRICATRAEWADRRAQDRKDAESILRSPNGSICVPVKNNQAPVC
jgi:hypothetical protein